LPFRSGQTEYDSEQIAQVCSTLEHAVRPEDLGSLLTRKIKSLQIRVLTNHDVRSVRRSSFGFITECWCDGQIVHLESDLVINAAWEGKRNIDRDMALITEDIWSLRVKMGLIYQTEGRPNWYSFTMVLGSFGDAVVFPGSQEVYCSWYPECLLMQTDDDKLPDEWQQTLKNQIDSGQLKETIRRSTSAIQAILPTLQISELKKVNVGAILARGWRSIKDPASEFHMRNDEPVVAHDGYFSINTGKFTSAPYNSLRLLSYL
jgi:hypothetical protein